MAISLNRYVRITSGVGAGNAVGQRDLIGRIMTTNPLLPTKSYKEFTSAEDVGLYFGFTSEEYKRAAFYFGFISKSIVAAEKISFGRWTNVAVAPLIYGNVGAQALATWNAISSGSFTLTMGAFTFTMSAMDFSAAGSLSAVATIIQTAIRAKTGGGTLWTTATVTWDPVRQSFNLVGGSTGVAVISVAAGTGGTDVASLLGWLTGPYLVLSAGAALETLTQTMVNTAAASNNFGSFAFITYLTPTQNLEIATWNDPLNVLFMFCVPTTAADASTNSSNLIGLSGNAITLSPTAGEYPELCPMILLATTDYSKINSVKNYMFQIFTLTPSVQTDADADLYDGLRINYYGRSQTAGQFVDFYQRGTMTGLDVDPVDQNVYANEMWLKDFAAAAIMTALLALERISANATGRAQLLSILQQAINAALRNGTISVGKILNNEEKLVITQITGDDQAWYQVETIGYVVDVTFEQVEVDNIQEYHAVYTLVYSKDDDIRKVEGTHVLI